MAPLPKNFSLQAVPIKAALSEARDADAERLVCEILRSGKADHVVQALAADMIMRVKRPRGRRKALRHFWREIGEQFTQLRADDVKYEDALRQVAEKFGYSESHCRNAIRDYEEVMQANSEALSQFIDEEMRKEAARK